MKQPDEVELSQEDGEALIERLQKDVLTADDRRLLVKLIQLYFWLSFSLRETKIGLKRLKRVLFGESKRTKRPPPDDGAGGGSGRATVGDKESAGEHSSAKNEPHQTNSSASGGTQRRQGHGRQPASVYAQASIRECRHETLAAGQRCPVCGRGTLYGLPPGVTIRIEGHALLSAVRYEVEKLRCSGCGEIFTAPLPAEAGEEKYTAGARAILALSRYYLGLPFHRLQAFQALIGVPVADATQWDQVERVADCAYAVWEPLVYELAQSAIIYQDDTTVRILSLIRENRRWQQSAETGAAKARTGMYTTALVGQSGNRTIVLYLSGRAHAGENLAEVLKRRAPGLPPPIVMSDALSANELEDESGIIRSHCLAHGYRQFREIDEVFPSECQRVLDDLAQVYDYDEKTRAQAMSPAARLSYHQRHSAPILTALKAWLEQQLDERLVEPNSSLGKAFSYLLTRWSSLTRFLSIPDAPLDNNTVERVLKLMIRQRHNSLFFASVHSAQVASLLSSLIATCAAAGVNALQYLIALQQHRSAVFAQPAAWLPWHYTEAVSSG